MVASDKKIGKQVVVISLYTTQSWGREEHNSEHKVIWANITQHNVGIPTSSERDSRLCLLLKGLHEGGYNWKTWVVYVRW